MKSLRNECVLLRLAEKYWRAKGIGFEFQARRSGVIFDGIVAQRIAIEFDEPHHKHSRRQSDRDAEKGRIAASLGLTLVRFTLAHDVIDIILLIDNLLNHLSGLETVFLKAEDFAAEITAHKTTQTWPEPLAASEHAANRDAVRKMLIERGIWPTK